MADGVDQTARFAIHQALHGYSDGHRLLAASTALNAADSRTMLVLSDLSGPGAQVAEQGYLTGYPLPDAGLYALARTWMAPEMPRPGCVWTHTLLVDFADLASMGSPASLASLFFRPEAPPDFSRYRRPLEPIAFEYPGPKHLDDPEVLERILWALYSEPESKVVASRRSHDLESLVLSVWEQQWPRLRRSFRFCTTSAADRSTEEMSFDLQLLPEHSRRREFVGVIDADELILPNPPRWLRHAVEDVVFPASSDLRQFMRRTGGDIIDGRGSFAPLCRLHLALQEASERSEALLSAVQLVEQEFPEGQGRAAYAAVARAIWLNPNALDARTLAFALRHVDLSETDDTGTGVARIGAALWRNDPALLSQLLARIDTPSIVRSRALADISLGDLVDGLAKAAAADSLPWILKQRPEIVETPAYWRLEAAERPESFSAVANTSRVRHVLEAMITSEKDLVAAAIAAFGSQPVFAAACSLIERHLGKCALPWLRAASRDVDVIAAALISGEIRSLETFEAIARVTSPDDVPNQIGTDPWVVALKAAQAAPLQLQAYHYLSSYFVVRALGRVSRNQAELFRMGFDAVYSAAWDDRLSREAWHLLDRRLPRVMPWREWDRCERLVEGIVEAFISRDLDPSLFGQLTSNDDVFSVLVDFAQRTGRGRRFLRRVAAALSESDSQRYMDRLRLLTEA